MYDTPNAVAFGPHKNILSTITTTTTTTAAAAPTVPPPAHESSNSRLKAAVLEYSAQHRTTSNRVLSTCSIITPSKLTASTLKNNSTLESCNPAETTHMTLLSLRRRRLFQRRACLLSILAAFIFGLALGVFMPMVGLANVFNTLTPSIDDGSSSIQMLPIADGSSLPLIVDGVVVNRSAATVARPPSDFPTIYELRAEAAALAEASSTDASVANAAGDNPYSVSFIKEEDEELTAEQVFRNAFHLEQDKNSPDAMIVKKLDANDGSIKEFRVERTMDGHFRKGPERRLSKPSLAEQVLQEGEVAGSLAPNNIHFVPMAQRIVENARNQRNHGIIKADIYWGDLVEEALPRGFTAENAKEWNHYVSTQGVVERLEPGCGRMQNRLVIFEDGTRACARYRQNTDQIQGELFSFYLGRLLNMSNLAPSAAAVIDVESRTWRSAVADITQAQWKQQRPVVLTRWLPELEPAGIPQPFQPLERHLNKYDVWNITLGSAAGAAAAIAEATFQTKPLTGNELSVEKQKGLLKRLGAASSSKHDHQSTTLEESSLFSSSSASASAAASASVASALAALNSNSISAAAKFQSSSKTLSNSKSPPSVVLQRLIELAQWSDLIVFDYLIANLDRVVNNLYNFQWNADIMAAPAHNLARQTDTQLLVFLDNESGLLHGYRLLKKYEAYHGLLLDNLCVFRQPTIEALRQLRTYGAGRKLRELFEQTTSAEVRDVLPALPDKSIKILVDRIDRVLGQVQKCKDLLADR